MVNSLKAKTTFLLISLVKRMNSISRFSAIGIPTIISIGIAWVGNRIIKNEKDLEARELELRLQLNNKLD